MSDPCGGDTKGGDGCNLRPAVQPMTSTMLTAADPEPPIGTRVRIFGHQIWQRQPEGYWIADDGDEPESWVKIAGNYGPAELVERA